MTLENIHKAIKPQFSWVDRPFKKLQTNEKNEQYAGFGLMVFVGIAASFDIPKSEICEYLNIKSPEFDLKLKRFQSYWEVIVVRRQTGKLGHEDFVDRVYLKTKLTYNAIQSYFPGDIVYCRLDI